MILLLSTDAKAPVDDGDDDGTVCRCAHSPVKGAVVQTLDLHLPRQHHRISVVPSLTNIDASQLHPDVSYFSLSIIIMMTLLLLLLLLLLLIIIIIIVILPGR
jgi:hypothetical protein